MDYLSTAQGQAMVENISYQLTRIADALELLAAAWGKSTSEEEEKKD